MPVVNLPIYVISVKSFEDRHRHIELQSQKHEFDYEYIFEYDADDLEKCNYQISDLLRPASASNVAKHIKAQERFLATDLDYCLVLEDDVVFSNNFFTEIVKVIEECSKLPKGWLVFLGGADNKIHFDLRSHVDSLMIESPITTAEAYLLDRAGCEARLKWVSNNVLDRQADHQLKLIDGEVGNKQFCLVDPIASQGSIFGMFKTSLDESRGRKPAWYLKARFAYNRIRNQLLPRAVLKLMKVFT